MTIEDMTHLSTLHALNREIYDLLSHFNARADGKTDRKFLVELRSEENRALMELLQKQKRALDYMAGRPVEPEVQFAEAVLIGIGSGGVQ